jgi:hypothetical protein
MKKAIGVIGATLLALTLCTPARALDLRLGANVNFGTSNDFGVGPRVELALGDLVPGLRLAADYHRFFDSGVYSDVDGLVVESSSWDAGVHVYYDLVTLPVAEGATIYAGGGLVYAKRSYDHWLKSADSAITDSDLRNRYDKLPTLQERYASDSGASFALTVGSTFNTGWTVIPYVEASYTIGVVDELMLAVGLLFSTGLTGGGNP